MPKKILVVDDEPFLVESISYNLKKEGYDVISSGDGRQGLELARSLKPDLVILDLMLPSLSGLDVCRQLRAEMNIPIIMLTAKGEEIDRIVGLKLGADDYMVKPFSMQELLARVEAVLRRTSCDAGGTEETYKTDGIHLDVSRHEVEVDGIGVELSPKEFGLLHILMANAGRVVSREMLLEKIWGQDFYGDDRTVDVHIRWLREKIEPDPSTPRRLVTVRGLGYKMNKR